jgi:hypothetical protein
MNHITRRLRELSTGRVKERRLSEYPHDTEMTIRPKEQKGYKQIKKRK